MAKAVRSKRRQTGKKISSLEKSFAAKKELANLIDNLKLERKSEKHDPQSASLSTLKEDSVPDQFKTIFAKFQPRNEPEKPGSRHADLSNSSIVEESRTNEKVLDSNPAITSDESAKVSRKKLRKLSKPALSELKSFVVYPEVIQWYDCDAPDPVLLSKIKTQKNVVQVPGHWQLKREYLSGRSVVAKRPFELPDVIRQTNIEEMRSTVPTQDAPDEKTLKESSRARIRPKLGSLDLDYRKLHDAFFKLGAHWKPDLMLPYGDLFYENRNLEEEARWSLMEKEKRPGRIGKDLRTALGLPEGKLPPWCYKFKELGMPPSYSGYKVAGVNWDISNLRGDVYGTLGTKLNSQKESELFGKMAEVEDSENDPENEADEAIDEKNNSTHDNEDTDTQNDAEEAQKRQELEAQIKAESMKEVLRRRQAQIKHKNSDAPKRLYSVIEQKEGTHGPNGVEGSVLYDIKGSRHEKEDNPNVDKNKKQHAIQKTEQDVTEVFKF
ncbi:LAQU0S02e01222g1_1 [Lachancea quebecensis]|uniref:LAQU0S02e01222g1_1 n=1 Tax=Lachancea quebecensis TaxID=1654605 RepID=A0A0P1KME3_9SACH|nr:LAQU0S02e01222g1_1 [Lachancea quebecensis]